MNGDISVYLQSDNAGYGILFTDGNKHWFYIDPENGVFDGVDLYLQSPLNTVKLLSNDIDIIEHLMLCLAFGSHTWEIPEYNGFATIDDVERYVTENVKSADGMVWYEIPTINKR